MKATVGVLILAAGASSRMGRTKALLPWQGTTVLEHLVGQVESAGLRQLVVVTGASHSEIQQKTSLRPELLCENEAWATGMGSSIGAGIDRLLQRFPDCRGVLILLADQPLVDAGYLEIICSQFSENPHIMIATKYGDTCGVPALFGRSHFRNLRQLPSDQGAKAILASAFDRVISIDPGHKGIDIDTPEAYEALKIQNDPLIRN